MRKFIIIFAFLIGFTHTVFSQCAFTMDTSHLPLTPWTNGYMYFKAWTDGNNASGTLCRTRYHKSLQLLGNTLDSFYVEWRMKIRHDIGRFMWIMGNYKDSGWAISYNQLYSYTNSDEDLGWVELWTDSNFTDEGEYNITKIYQLGQADSNWHTYKVFYNKASQTLYCYVDGSLENTYTDYKQFKGNNTDYTFTVGHRWAKNFSGINGAYTGGNIPLDDNYFEGYIDHIKIRRWNNDASLGWPEMVYWPFHEGNGQVIHDSLTYKSIDWALPGEPLYDCGFHLLNGISYARDSFDGVWFREGSHASIVSPLGSGLAYWNSSENIYIAAFGLGVYVWDSLLIAMGRFNRINVTNYSYDSGDTANFIAAWNGSTWSKLGSGFSGLTEKAIEYRDTLIVTGQFSNVVGGPTVNNIAKYDGSNWSGLGTGLVYSGKTTYGLCLTTWGDSLYVGGAFTTAGGNSANNIAKWDGSSWAPLGSGCNYNVWSMAVFNNKLYVGGGFNQAGGKNCYGIAVWDGANWDTVGTGARTKVNGCGIVYTLYVWNDTLWAGGVFKTMNGITCNNIAMYDGNEWHAAGTGAETDNGCFDTGEEAAVDNIYAHCYHLYFSGNFYWMDGKPVNKICERKGNSFCAVNFGFDTRCKDMASYPSGTGTNYLIVTGDIQWGNGFGVNGIVGLNIGDCDAPNYTSISQKSFLLYQNYPNPFNPVTNIKYNVPMRGLVKIRIYDIIGREVKTLVNEIREPGLYSVDFDATNYASGVYFYKFEAGDMTEVKKMVLLK